MIKRNDKAITLIALVVTILVILIIAGVALVTLTGDNGIIGNAEKTKFLNQIKAYQEELKLYLGGSAIDVYVNHTAGEVVNVGLEDQPGIETIIKDISDGEKDQIIIQGNVLYYKYTGNKQRAEWCFKAGIPVWGYSSYDAFVEDISNAPITKGEYSATDGVYVNAPDLTGFNTKNTYYVLYDASGNETIGNSLKVGAPTNITDWYDYSSSAKKWANIVTIGGDGDSTNLDNDRAYFVWIPRYVYKLNKTAQEADIKFVNINNQYKDFADSTLNATYSDTEPTYDADGNQTNYCLPDAFKWGTTPIAGFWVSKYEVSAGYGKDVTIDDVEFSVTDTTSTITNMKVTNTGSISIASYEVFANGVSKGTATSISSSNQFVIQGLTANTEYNIKIYAKDSGGTVLGIYENGKIKTTEKSIAELTKPNLKGFQKDHTYYVTYDASGNEVIGDNVEYDNDGVPTKIPSGWYDYENKLWANIVTFGGDGDKTNENNNKAYFTWIPRYEYRLKNTWQEAEIRFISTTQTEANTALGYQLPDAFKWGTTPISGYWVSKYELKVLN